MILSDPKSPPRIPAPPPPSSVGALPGHTTPERRLEWEDAFAAGLRHRPSSAAVQAMTWAAVGTASPLQLEVAEAVPPALGSSHATKSSRCSLSLCSKVFTQLWNPW